MMLNENIMFSENLSKKDITEIIMSNIKNDPKYKEMMVAEKYYNLKSDIDNKKQVYYDRDKKPIDNPAASNVKIHSNFLRELIQQKQDYCLSKTFILKIKDENNDEVDLSDNDYGKEWNKFLNATLFSHSYKQIGDAVNYGVAWSYIYINSDGDLKLKNVLPYSLFPIWKEREHLNLDRVVYNYFLEKYESLSPNVVEYAEYWDKDERILFNVSDGYTEQPLFVDRNNNPIHSQMMQGEEQLSWEKVPFISLKGTVDEKPLINFIKDEIDAYESLNSTSVDELKDAIDPLLITKGISPDVGDLIEARELMKLVKMVSLDPDGDAHFIQPAIDIQSNSEKLALLRKDIIHFGYGVDFDDVRFGGNPNQMVIKSLFQNLDIYVNGLERSFQDYIDNLKYFFDKWYDFTGRGSFDECRKYKVLINFDRDMMINESSLIEDTVKLSGTGVSQKTLLEYNPVVQDVDMELQRIEDQQKEGAELFNFPTATKEDVNE